jgi:hypothetical protein
MIPPQRLSGLANWAEYDSYPGFVHPIPTAARDRHHHPEPIRSNAIIQVSGSGADSAAGGGLRGAGAVAWGLVAVVVGDAELGLAVEAACVVAEGVGGVFAPVGSASCSGASAVPGLVLVGVNSALSSRPSRGCQWSNRGGSSDRRQSR